MPQLDRPSSSLETWTKVIYALHAFSLLTGILGVATVVGAFLTGCGHQVLEIAFTTGCEPKRASSARHVDYSWCNSAGSGVT